MGKFSTTHRGWVLHRSTPRGNPYCRGLIEPQKCGGWFITVGLSLGDFFVVKLRIYQWPLCLKVAENLYFSKGFGGSWYVHIFVMFFPGRLTAGNLKENDGLSQDDCPDFNLDDFFCSMLIFQGVFLKVNPPKTRPKFQTRQGGPNLGSKFIYLLHMCVCVNPDKRWMRAVIPTQSITVTGIRTFI